jgi:K+-transporting ATPase ATPase C chain
MVYGSGSGLDPDISLEAALSQLPAVAAARGLDAAAGAALEARIRAMAAASTTLLGPPRVNVVSLNADLGY